MAILNSSVVIPVEYSKEIIKGIIGKSKALELGRRLPDMVGKTYKLNVLSSLPVAGWVSNGTTPAGAANEIKNKPISDLAWQGKDITAEEIAVIVPVAIETLRDLAGNYVTLVPMLTEQVVGAFANVIDGTVFFGTNSPFAGVDDVVSGATTANAIVSWDGAGATFYDAVSDAMSLVEESGYIPNAILGGPSLRGAFRKMRTTEGQQILGGEIVDESGLARHYDLTGGFDDSTAFAIVGDFNYLVYSIRQEIEMKVLEEATLVNPSTGATLFNLAQQDMVAFRFTMRLGYQLPNPINRVGGAETRYPFALIEKSEEQVTE